MLNVLQSRRMLWTIFSCFFGFLLAVTEQQVEAKSQAKCSVSVSNIPCEQRDGESIDCPGALYASSRSKIATTCLSMEESRTGSEDSTCVTGDSISIAAVQAYCSNFKTESSCTGELHCQWVEQKSKKSSEAK